MAGFSRGKAMAEIEDFKLRKELFKGGGIPPPLYICDQMAYKLLNDADSLPGALSGWVERKKEEGKLWCLNNWDCQVPGWKQWVPIDFPSEASKYMIYFLRILGFSEATPALEESMLTYVYSCWIATAPRPTPTGVWLVFVTGNEEFVNAFKTVDAWRKVVTFMDFFFAPFAKGTRRVWPVFCASASDTEPVEEFLDASYVRLPPEKVEKNTSPFVSPYSRPPNAAYVRELFETAQCPFEEGPDGLVPRHQYYRMKRKEEESRTGRSSRVSGASE